MIFSFRLSSFIMVVRNIAEQVEQDIAQMEELHDAEYRAVIDERTKGAQVKSIATQEQTEEVPEGNTLLPEARVDNTSALTLADFLEAFRETPENEPVDVMDEDKDTYPSFVLSK